MIWEAHSEISKEILFINLSDLMHTGYSIWQKTWQEQVTELWLADNVHGFRKPDLSSCWYGNQKALQLHSTRRLVGQWMTVGKTDPACGNEWLFIRKIDPACGNGWLFMRKIRATRNSQTHSTRSLGKTGPACNNLSSIRSSYGCLKGIT
jgi:hypothetical protein